MSVTEMIKVLPTQPGRYLAGGTACSHGLQRQHRHQAQCRLERRDTPNCAGKPLPKSFAGSSLPPSFWDPSETQGRDPREDPGQERSETAPASHHVASITQQKLKPSHVTERSSHNTSHPQAASVYTSAKGTVITSQVTHPREDQGSDGMAPRPWASACHLVRRSPSDLKMQCDQGTCRSGALEAASSSSGGLFFTGVVCEQSFVAKKLPSYCSESKDKATVKITLYFDSSQIVTINDPFSPLSCMLINVV